MYPLSLYLSKHAWGRREDVEVLSYTHANAKPGPFPSADQRSILPEMAPQGQHLETEHNCSKQRKTFLTPGFQMAAGKLHVAADIQS